MEAIHEQKPVRKFYVFDRDDTVISKDHSLINPHFIVPFMQRIAREESFQWAVASAGASEWAADDFSIALFVGMGDYFPKKPFYTQLANRWDSLQNLVCSVEGVEPRWAENDPTHFAEQARVQKVTPDVVVARNIFGMLSEPKEIIEINDGEHTTQQFVSWDLNDTVTFESIADGSFVFTTELYFQLKLGNTFLTIHAETFFKHREAIEKGHNKLFCILEALDKAQLILDRASVETLKNLGITRIECPVHYQTISAKDVVFVDDRLDNCVLVEFAGFTAIQADTPIANEKKKSETTDTYIAKLKQTVPTDILAKHFKQLADEIKKANLEKTPFEQIEAWRTDALTELMEWFTPGRELNTLEGVSALGPLFAFDEFRLKGKSIDTVPVTHPGLLALADAYIAKGQYHKELSHFLVERFSTDWKNATAREKMKQVANIRSGENADLSPTLACLAYREKYDGEKVSWPFSTMRKQTKTAGEFNMTMEQIRAEAKKGSRTEEVLEALGASKAPAPK